MGSHDQIQQADESRSEHVSRADGRSHLAQSAMHGTDAGVGLRTRSDETSAAMVRQNVLPGLLLDKDQPPVRPAEPDTGVFDAQTKPAAGGYEPKPAPDNTNAGGSLDDLFLKEKKTLPGGTVVRTYEDGGQDFKYPDGTGYRHDANGNEIFTDKKGNTFTKYPDGERMGVTSDGTTTRYHKDGSVERDTPQGLHERWSPDGTASRSLHGVQQEWAKDGSYKITSPSLTISMLPDGKMTLKGGADDGIESDEIHLTGSKEADGTVSYKTDDGGLEIKRTPDGSIHTVFNEGSLKDEVILHSNGQVEEKLGDVGFSMSQPDGSVIVEFSEDKDLRKVQIWPDGRFSGEKTDNSKEISYPDGTVQTVAPDGTVSSRKIELRVDGQEVTGLKQEGRQVIVHLKDGSSGFVIESEGGKIVLQVGDEQRPISGDGWSMERLYERASFADYFAAGSDKEQL